MTCSNRQYVYYVQIQNVNHKPERNVRALKHAFSLTAYPPPSLHLLTTARQNPSPSGTTPSGLPNRHHLASGPTCQVVPLRNWRRFNNPPQAAPPGEKLCLTAAKISNNGKGYAIRKTRKRMKLKEENIAQCFSFSYFVCCFFYILDFL